MKTETYEVTGMTCGGCVNRVKATLANLADVAEVTLEPPQATLTNPHADKDTLNQALSAVGHYVLLSAKSAPKAKNQTAEPNPTAKPNPITNKPQSWFATYRPLLLVFTYILLVCLFNEWAQGAFSSSRFMVHFMAGFFLVFSFFKMLDLPAFANSYAMYDVLAKRWPTYGLLYPFIELGLGVAYLINGHSVLVNAITLIVMVFSSIGVIVAVLKKQKIRCACLGAVFNLPMSTVTIIEDLLMAAMAAWMLL